MFETQLSARCTFHILCIFPYNFEILYKKAYRSLCSIVSETSQGIIEK
jgi:REP element-mobilizing transposase RayT